MNKKILILYYSITILFILLIVAWAGYRVNLVLGQNLSASRGAFENLKVSALSTYLAEGSFESQYFREKMKKSFKATDRLLLLAVYSPKEGIRYLLAKSKKYLVSPLSGDSSWQGQPEYEINPIRHLKLSSTFSPGIQKDLYIDGLFERISRADLNPVLRETLYIFLVYLLSSGIILLIISTSKKTKPFESVPRPYPAGTAGEKANPSKQDKGLFSPETGLGWKEHLKHRLDFELKRAASFDQDLSLIFIALEDSGGRADFAYRYRQLGKVIAESFPFKDLAFEYGDNAYAVILLDRDVDQALKDIKAFKAKAQSSEWLGAGARSISIGLSARNGRLISGSTLLLESRKSLGQARRSGGERIVAFRADPEKFRRLMALRKT